MNLGHLLSELSDAGVRLRVKEGKLDVHAPRGVLTPALVATLTEHKAELIELLAGGDGEEAPEALEPDLERRYEPFPLTDIEQAYWVGRSGADGSGVAMHAYLEIDCREFDPERWEEAWNKLVSRHDMLRAVGLDGGQRRILASVPRYEIKVEDARGDSGNARAAELRTRLSHQVIDLEKWPLFEVCVLRLEDALHRVFLSVDCTFIDAWSFQTLVRELIKLYKDPETPLAPEQLELSFRDYVLAAHKLTETATYRRSLEYWRGRIAALPAAPELPRVRNASLLGQLRFRRWQCTLDKPVYTRLQKQASANGLTLPGLLLACYAEVLGRWSANPHFTLNVPLFNRAPLHPQVNDTLGTFSSFILVEIEHRAGEPFATRARRIQDQLWRDLEHRHAGGVHVLRELFRSQGAMDEALMPVVFTSFPSAGGKGCRWVEFIERELGEVRHIVTQTPQVWIDHHAVYQEDSLYLSWDAASDLFPAGMIDAMFSAYEKLLRRVADESGAWTEGSPVQLSEEQAAERARSNDTQAPIEERLLQAKFFEHAARNPDHPAVIASNCTLTYGELSHRAVVLARLLREAGAQPNEPVAVVMEKGWEQVAGLLGALASGSPYLPVDSSVPAERLKYLLENGGVRVAFTQSRLCDSLAWPEGVTPIAIDTVDYLTGPEERIESPHTPDDVAVLLYTSGSTGLPNAVLLGHRGIVNCIDNTIRHFNLGPDDRALALTNLHHDMSMFDVFGMLSAGGTIVMPDAGRRRDPSHWIELMENERVSVWNSVPATMMMLAEFLGYENGQLPASLRLVYLGGDWIPVTLPERLRELAKGVKVVSVGGPTETTLWNIWYEIGEVDREWKSIPYGRPIANAKYYVLDDALEDRPVWVPGEIFTSGAGVAKGYFGNPQKTAERFITHPVTGERLYRTGDLGRYLPGGVVELLGRKDFQLSIRGHRIEPAEIEAALAQHPGIKAAVVSAAGEGIGQRLVGYVVANEPAPADSELREFLRNKLPPHMIPPSYVFLDRFPLTANGKLDRKAFPKPALGPAEPQLENEIADELSEKRLEAIVCEVLGVKRVSLRDNFFELGANSIHLIQIHVRLKERWKLDIPITDLFQHPSIGALARHLVRRPEIAVKASAKAADRARDTDEGIAIVGMSCRFPGARNAQEFWSNLAAGRESVAFYTEEELRKEGVPSSALRNANYVRAGAPLEDIDLFDGAFFGMMPREAQTTDPQQRLFLECEWEALENAGYGPESCRAAIGVYAGKTMSNYLYPHLGELTRPVNFFQGLIGNDKDFLSTQISYKLNLKGPSITVQTACSTSLVAAAMACQALASGDCDMALAGGVSLKIPHRIGYLYEEGSVFSADGHCRVFDANARGTVPGSGVGIVVLKRVADAIADGDSIYAVIKGWALNNDGAHKVGFTAPSLDGQAEVIRAAQRRAQIDAETISYVEAHGTATPIGDPIEVAALTRAFRETTAGRGYCALGSVKSNVGHLDAAAGVAGLIKTALALHHKMLPPSLHYESPNPRIDFESSPFYVNAQLSPWERNGFARRAGVSSFGIGGTNAHLVLEEAPERPVEVEGKERPWQALTLSAKSEAALVSQVRQYAMFLNGNAAGGDARGFADVCHAANTGRTHFEHRLAVVSTSAEDAARQLEEFANGTPGEGMLRNSPTTSFVPKIAFLFTGQGAQYVEMGRQLYGTEPVFRDAMDECDRILQAHLEPGLLRVLYPPAGEESPIHEITYAQPVLFSLEYALAMLWRSWGIEPSAVMGHSTGEYAAACVAGVFSLEDGLKLVAARGRLMEVLALKGETLAVFAPEAKVAEVVLPLAAEIAIAAINGPENVVVSGTPQAIETVAASMRDCGIETRKLNIPRAAHSPLMEPMLEPFAEEAGRISYGLPRIELVSNVTGRVATDDVALPEYWLRQVRRTVQFAAGMKTLEELGCGVFIEIGPKATLIGMAQQSLTREALLLPSLRPGHEDGQQMLESLAALHVDGIPVDWARLQTGPRRKPALPTYPFERQRYWAPGAGALFPFAGASRAGGRGEAAHPLLGRRLRVALEGGERLYESQLSQQDPEFVQSHRVFGATILPAAAYLEIALAAAGRLDGECAIRIEDVVLPQALILPEEDAVTVQCHVEPGEHGASNFRILSAAQNGENPEEEWVLHASGSLRIVSNGAAQEAVDLDALQAGFAEEVSVRQYYKRALDAGTNFGAAFQGIAKLWSRGEESLGLIEIPAAIAAEAPEYTLHPAFLDACLQVIGTSFPELGPDETFLPVGVERLTVYGQPGHSVWSHAVMRSAAASLQHTVKADLRLIGVDGRIVAVIEGLLMRRSNASTLLRSKKELLQNWLYEIDWHKDASEVVEDAQSGRGWLVFADAAGIGSKLAQLLRGRGDKCIVARRGNKFTDDGDEFTIDPGSSADYERLLAYCDANLPERRQAVHLWSLNAEEFEAAELGCASTLALVRGVANWKTAPALTLVTSEAQPAGDSHSVSRPWQACLWGLGQIVTIEHPELHCRRIDIDARVAAQAAADLFGELFTRTAEEDQVAIRGGNRYVARLVRSESKPHVGPIAVRSDATYLVTGGMGRLGSIVAEWLVERGARHVAVVGRRKPSPAVEERLEALRRNGADIVAVEADVSSRSGVLNILGEIAANMPPLRGIVHAAGVIDDGVVEQQTWERLEKVLAPKAEGAWNLHELTQDLPVDFFVMFSSVASLVGTPGQASHASANAFLDSLAHHRRAQGLPALSINWGPWAGLGPAMRGAMPVLEGLGSLTAAQGLAILEYLMNGDCSQAGVVPIDWPRFLRHSQAMPFFSKLAASSVPETSNVVGILEQMERAGEDERFALLSSHIESQVARILGRAPSEHIATDKGLFSLGLDSLASLVLRNRLQSSLQCALPSTLVFNHPTIHALARYLASEKLTAWFPVTAEDAESQEKQGCAPEELDRLSEDEVARLLARKITAAI